MAEALRAGDACPLAQMHEGVLAYLHWKNGYPPLYACMADMPAETGLVFEYCLATDRAKGNPQDLEAAQEAFVAQCRALGIPLIG